MKLLQRLLVLGTERPLRVAYCQGKEALTYGELVSGALSLAAALEERLGDNHAPVAVYGARQGLMPTAFLACLLCGRSYLPLEDSYPPHRVLEILENSGAALLLAVEPFPQSPLPTLGREELAALCAQRRPDFVPIPLGEEELCYLLYTSGSTGVPKGVEITAGNLDAFLEATATLAGPDPGETVWLTHAPFTFDLSVLPLWQGLGRGGRVVNLDTRGGMDFAALFGEMAHSGATCWVSTPSFVRFCLADPSFCANLLPCLSTFYFCGETLPGALARTLMERFPGVRLLNSYGPTEATVAVTLTPISQEMAEGERPLPVGRPLAGVELSILSPEGRPLPQGEWGEIAIAGAQVGRGYHNLPALSAQRFPLQPAGQRYLTGDLGCMVEGMLYFGGRQDFQVKCRGCRVELGDLEQNLLALEGVSAAVAVASHDRLGAAVVAVPGVTLSPRGLLEQLRRRLPRYLLPQRVRCLAALPLTPGGKTNRQAVEALIFPREEKDERS